MANISGDVRKGLRRMFSKNSLASSPTPGATRSTPRERAKRPTLAMVRELNSQASSNTDSSSSFSITMTTSPPAPSVAASRSPSILPTSRLQRKEKPKLTTDQLRELRELIRHRYTLDVDIWRQRREPEWNRSQTEEQMIQADAALVKLKQMVKEWDSERNFSTAEEYEQFQEIRKAILAKGKRNWKQEPPWETEETDTQFVALQLSYVKN